MAGQKKKHHLDRPAFPAAQTAFRWQVPHLRALLILFQFYPDLTNGDRKNVMWHLFPELQARGYEEGHFYDQYQPRWSSSRSSKAWQAVETPNTKSADTYTPQDFADHAGMIRQVQEAAEVLEINLRPVSLCPLSLNLRSFSPYAQSMESRHHLRTLRVSLRPKKKASRSPRTLPWPMDRVRESMSKSATR